MRRHTQTELAGGGHTSEIDVIVLAVLRQREGEACGTFVVDAVVCTRNRVGQSRGLAKALSAGCDLLRRSRVTTPSSGSTTGFLLMEQRFFARR
jgi:hypothetical protein